MADVPTGIGGVARRRLLVELEAFGEIMNVPPPQLAAILAKARKELTQKPGPPPGPPGPPTP